MTHRRAVGLMVLVALLWSIAGVVTRHLDTARAFEVTFWRSAFNTLALLVMLGCMRGSLLWRGLLRAGWAVWISGLCWGVMYTAFMLALTLTSVANVLITMAISPLLTALLSRFFLGHRLPMRTWLAIVVAGVGIAWMFAAQAEAGASLLGSLVAGAVPLAGAVNLTVLQRVGKDAVLTEDMLPAVLIGAVLSALATLPLAWPMQVSSHDLGLLALLEVVFGVTWAWVGAGETPASSVLFGGGLVLAALAVNELLVLRRVS